MKAEGAALGQGSDGDEAILATEFANNYESDQEVILYK